MALPVLQRKLFRDLIAMKGQAVAIALVAAAGVAMYVMYLSNFESLRRTQHAYYERQRFADAFASLKRAPSEVAEKIAAIPGIDVVETRVVAQVRLDLPTLDAPATGRFISIPDNRRPALNDLVLRRGRWIERGHSDEVLVSEAFASAHELIPGDPIHAIINGHRRRLTIVGIALSPEYVYSVLPGQLIPDDQRFGVFWMGNESLAAAFDMEGGFNDVVIGLSREASTKDVIDRVDRALLPYGGLGATPRALQLSHWMVESELSQLQTFGTLLPLIFLGVAAFILNVALARALALQRPQIASLKALGYGNIALGWHYLQFALVIAAAGVVIGLVAGAWMGSAVGALYNKYFRFPDLAFTVPLGVVLGASGLTLGAAAGGALSTVSRAIRMPPAEAMRPAAPERYRRSIIESPRFAHRLSSGERMVLRNVVRHPVRAALSICGIALAIGVLMVGVVFLDVMERLMMIQFWVAEREDVTVTLTEPHAADAWYALSRLPGVMAAEPQRSVPARIRAAHHERYLAVTGVTPGARLQQVVDRDGRQARVSPWGVTLSKTLAEILEVAPGETITIEVLEGNRPVHHAVVAHVVDDMLGLVVLMDMDRLHALMDEGQVVTGAVLLVDASQEAALARELKRIPHVLGSGFKRAFARTFRSTMAANMNLTMFVNLIFAVVIAFGVVYNAARVALSERSRDLASLRVLGFTRGEVSTILAGELAILTIVAVPIGWMFGYVLVASIMQTVQSEVYRIPFTISHKAMAQASLGILAATFASGFSVIRRLDRLDLIAVLKVHE